jgi:hypothetical protein
MTGEFQRLWDACLEAEKTAERDPHGPTTLWSIDRETYRLWKANAGNAKARRRWRRRDIPNGQRAEVIAMLHQRIDTLADQIEAQR